jgi:hypothetical protein
MGRPMTVPCNRRRGVLLLVVLSMLTLFMMLGTTYVVIASRARRTARAFATNINATSSAGIDSQRFLDEAFMAVARGTTGTSAIAALRQGDDLLGDKYGSTTPLTGQITGNATGAAIISLPVNLGSPHLLAGRVITFTLPTLSDVSTRILRADATTLYLPAGQTVNGASITVNAINAAKALAADNKHFLINGREFDGSSTNESYDAFATTSGTSDPALARIQLISGSTSVTPSFGKSSPQIDNDGDGTPDSDWIDVGFPVITDAAGNQFKPKAAVLVIDMDGRLNLNVHGSRTDLENTAATTDCSDNGVSATHSSGTNFYPSLSFSSTSGTTTVPILALPRGQGVGPAELSLFGPVAGSANSTGVGEMLSGSPTEIASLADKYTGRPRPVIGGPEGRYGSDNTTWDPQTNPDPLATAKPGNADKDDNNTLDRWTSSSGTTAPLRYFEDTNTRYGSPSDLKGRMRVWTDAFGQPVYYKPYWGKTAASGGRGLFADDDIIDDPYELNLGRSGPRTGAVKSSAGSSAAADNLYGPADLEGVLRFFDPDSMRLSRRLISICRNCAADARLLITTESWDTPAITGKAWSDVVATQFATLLQGSSAQDFFSPETIMGHKFDLNRAFHDPALLNEDLNNNGVLDPGEDSNSNGVLDSAFSEPSDTIGIARRQQFAKHFYCLLVALFQKNSGAAPTPIQAEQLAQWAVNVVDFRDDDSIMTPFDYDEMFAAGSTSWNASKRVWGCERPEILITETLAWHDRKTDDTDTNKKVTESDQSQADNDFDQKYRPRGAFFVELYSPWGSQAKQYSSSGIEDVTRSGTSAPAYRGEPLPSELVSGSTATARFERDATINLARTHSGTGNSTTSGTGSPVWRLVTVRGNAKNGTAFGADPFATGTSGTSAWIVDPSRQGSTASIDRIFYFTGPPQPQRDEKEGAVFWQSGSSQTASAMAHPSQSRYVVVGTNRLTANYASGVVPLGSPNAAVDRYFDQPSGVPATISEPLALTTPPTDGYEALATSGTFQVMTAGDLYSKQLSVGSDPPLDSFTSHPTENPETSPPFLDANDRPILMQNGTHENFAVVHLQRLANPTKAWDISTNPYLTVDSMPVDLTVVNTANVTDTDINATAGTNYDEPAFPANDYRYASTERGGKPTDFGAAANESDIWNRRANASTVVNSPTNAEAFRTPAIDPRDAKTISPVPPDSPPPGQSYKLQPSTVTVGSITLVAGTNNASTANPSRFPTTRYPWLVWANRPFTSAAELVMVPTPNAFRLPGQHTTASGTSTGSWAAGTRPFNHLCGLFESGTTPPDPWRSVIGTSGTAGTFGILDFVHVPSRFTGSYLTVSASTTNASTIGLDKFPINQISHFREPGRVNVNTLAMSAMSQGTISTGTSWNPLFGKVAISGSSSVVTPPLLGMAASGSSSVSGTTFTVRPPFSPPPWNEQSPPNPFISSAATSPLTILAQIGNDSTDNTASWPPQLQEARDHKLDAYFRYDMEIRMANMVTSRSSVFAVWVTIGYFDIAGNEIEPVRRNRAFYIFDRSIPVGYQTGKDHNVRDAILLRRIIQ